MLCTQITVTAAFILFLMIGCVPASNTPDGGTVSPTPQLPDPGETACSVPTGQYPLHVVSSYTTGESPTELDVGLRHYVIKAQEFSADHIYTTVSEPNAAFSLDDALPVLAVGRTVTNTASPPSLPLTDERIAWQLYIRGQDGQDEIICRPETGFFWQEIVAVLNPIQGCQDFFAYTLPISQVCVMPLNTTTEELGRQATDNNIWIDAAVFDLKNGNPGLYRFSASVPDQSAGPVACRRSCNPIKCNSPLGCFMYRLCRLVCPK